MLPSTSEEGGLPTHTSGTTSFMAQDSRLTTLTSLTAGLSEEWGDGTAGGDASHAVLRTPAGDQQLVMLGASHPIPAHA